MYHTCSGETTANVAQILQGHLPGKLTDIGIKQANLVGHAFVQDKTVFDKVYCSDLGRCRETLAAIHSSYPVLKEVHTEYTPMIREKGGGVLEGKSLELTKEASSQTAVHWTEFKVEGAESWNDVYQRVESFWNLLFATHGQRNTDSEHVLVISHGGFLKSALDHYLVSIGQNRVRGPLKNASISTIQVVLGEGPDANDVLALNRTAHLLHLHTKEGKAGATPTAHPLPPEK